MPPISFPNNDSHPPSWRARYDLSRSSGFGMGKSPQNPSRVDKVAAQISNRQALRILQRAVLIRRSRRLGGLRYNRLEIDEIWATPAKRFRGSKAAKFSLLRHSRFPSAPIRT